MYKIPDTVCPYMFVCNHSKSVGHVLALNQRWYATLLSIHATLHYIVHISNFLLIES